MNWEEHPATRQRPASITPQPDFRQHADELDDALHGNPVEFFNLSSVLIDSLLHVEEESLGQRSEPNRQPLLDLLKDLSEDDSAATNSWALTVATLLNDPAVLRRVSGRTIDNPGIPTWLARLDELVVLSVEETSHPYRDGSDVVFTLQFADRQKMTVSVYMSNHSGYAIGDVLAYGGTADEARPAALLENQDPHIRTDAIDPALARERIQGAVEYTQMMWPPVNTESWPLYQPLVAWLLRQLPEPEHPLPDWEATSSEVRNKIAQSFFESGHARGAEVLADHVEMFLDYKDGFGNRDLYRWNPTEVEIFLADWVLRKYTAPDEVMTKIPGALRSFIPFAHEQLNFPADLTQETVAAVDRWEGAFHKGLTPDRKTGAQAIIEQMREDGA